MNPTIKAALAAALVLGLTAGAQAQSTKAKDSRVKRGEYLATIMDCGGCHTPGVFLGKPDASRPFAGSEVGFQIPGLGVFFPPNLTPDKATGLGSWSEKEIVAAIRTGVRPDGRVLAPAMPYKHYGALTDADASALAAYLKSLPPVVNQVPPMTGASQKPSGPYLTVAMP
jgi:mono/diheme cytochrome c family protein